MTVIGGEIGNGDFESDSGSPLSFEAVSHWHNLDGGDDTTNLGTTQGMVASPQPNSQGAFLVGAMAGNDTGYVVAAEGEAFNLSLALHKFGAAAAYDGDEVLDAILFTVDGAVDANTSAADITVLGTASFPVNEVWAAKTADAFYTSTAGDVGSTVYLALDLQNPDGRMVSPRIDTVVLTVTPAP